MTKRKKIDEREYALVIAEAIVESELEVEEFLESFDEEFGEDENRDLELAWYLGWVTCAAEVKKKELPELLAEYVELVKEEEDE